MLQYKEEYITNPKNIWSILEAAKPEWKKREKLYRMKTRKNKPSDLVASTDDNMKIPFESVISNMVNGYMGGKAPIYSVDEAPNQQKQNVLKQLFNKLFNKNNDDRIEYQLFIDFIRDFNDDPYFYYKLVQDYNDMSASYGIWYENDKNEIVYANTDARQTIAIYDFSTPVNKIALLRHWVETNEKGEEVDVVVLTTENYKYHFCNGKKGDKEFKEEADQREEVKWGCVPAIAIENPDGLACFEIAKSCICAYERVMKNSKNTFQYNDDAKLQVTGYEPEEPTLIEQKNENGEIVKDEEGNIEWIANPKRKKEDQVVLEAPVFYAGEGGSIEWIEKNLNDSALQNYKKTLIDLIFMLCNCPNVNDLGFTNADNSSALEKKFFPLEQSVAYLDKSLKKELLAMWEAFTERINLKRRTNYDFRNLKIKLQRNMPTDKKAETDRALSLRGLLSDETIINLLPDELDATNELDKIKKQNEENLNENIKKIKSFGKEENDVQDDEEDAKSQKNASNITQAADMQKSQKE